MTEEQPQTIHLLVVEDNPGDAAIVQAYLQSSDITHVQTDVATLAEALAALLQANFDVVMVDLNLPDSTGVATVEAIIKVAKTMPVIAMTGTKSDEIGLRCVELGAQDFVSKSDLTPMSLERSIKFSMARHAGQKFNGTDAFLSHYRRMSNEGRSVPMASAMMGVAPLKDLLGEDYQELQQQYSDTLAAYLKSLVSPAPQPKRPMLELVRHLGITGAGPRDLIDLHVEALGRVVANVETARAQALALDARLMALELMGLLVDFYRQRSRRDRLPPTENPTGNP